MHDTVTRTTSAPEQLRDWMRRRGLNQAETAELFGWHETFISQLVNGHRTPGLKNAVAIHRETGIAPEAWASSRLDTSRSGDASAARKRRNDKV